MRLVKLGTAAALAVAAAACGQGNSDNMISPDANALEPADVNAALGTEVTNTQDMNMTANDMNVVDNGMENSETPDEPTVDNSDE